MTRPTLVLCMSKSAVLVDDDTKKLFCCGSLRDPDLLLLPLPLPLPLWCIVCVPFEVVEDWLLPLGVRGTMDDDDGDDESGLIDGL